GSIFKIICPFDLGPVIEYPFQVKYNALIISDELPYNSVKLLHSMGIKSYTLETIKNQKCDLIILDKEITDEKTIFGLKEAYGNDRVYVISIYKYEQRKLNSIHLIMEYPVSRKTLYQRLMSISNISVEEITEDLSDQTILNGYALIVDDNRLNRIALESILTKSGMTSKSVNSGLNAINAVKNESFDIVLMDVQMPDMDGIETSAFGPGVIGSYFKDNFFRRLTEDFGTVGPVGHIKVTVIVRRGGRVEPPVDAALFPLATGKPVMMRPYAARPAPGRPTGHAVFFSGFAVPGEKEMFMNAVILLLRIDLLQFRVGIKVAREPKLDVLKLAGPSAQALRNRFGANGGIAADRSVINPVAGLYHVGDLTCRSFLVANFLLYRCRHSILS
ncbi:MAG: hypothetical protein CVV62_00260, partial [Tenericutes bacterium HGW-Tenericutes-7]